MKYADPYCPRLFEMTRIMIEFTRTHRDMPTHEQVAEIKRIIARDVYPESAK